MVERPSPPQRPHHEFGQKRPIAEVGDITLAERPVQEDVGVRSPPVDAGEDRKRLIPYRDSRSPFFTRRPWA